MKIYLASPFFNEKELENVRIAEKILTERGFSLFSPRLNEVRTDENTQQSWWSKETFMNDKKFIEQWYSMGMWICLRHKYTCGCCTTW